jgi:hypothetical protein
MQRWSRVFWSLSTCTSHDALRSLTAAAASAAAEPALGGRAGPARPAAAAAAAGGRRSGLGRVAARSPRRPTPPPPRLSVQFWDREWRLRRRRQGRPQAAIAWACWECHRFVRAGAATPSGPRSPATGPLDCLKGLQFSAFSPEPALAARSMLAVRGWVWGGCVCAAPNLFVALTELHPAAGRQARRRRSRIPTGWRRPLARSWRPARVRRPRIRSAMPTAAVVAAKARALGGRDGAGGSRRRGRRCRAESGPSWGG